MNKLFDGSSLFGDLREGLFPVIDMLKEAGVFFFYTYEGKICLSEGCEGKFERGLTKQQLKDLAKEINTIAEGIADEH